MASIPDASQMEFYLEGACDLFAAALARELGYQPIALRFYFPNGKEWSTPHVFAMSPRGTPVDAGGPTTTDGLVAREWHVAQEADDVRLVPLTERQAANELHQWSDQDIEEAVEFIRENAKFYTTS